MNTKGTYLDYLPSTKYVFEALSKHEKAGKFCRLLSRHVFLVNRYSNFEMITLTQLLVI